jgi:hypothetical protein
VRAIGYLLLAAVLVSASTVEAATNVSVDAPSLTVGDTWTYRTNTSLTRSLALEGRVTLTVTGRGLTSVEGHAFDAYTLDVAGKGTASGTVVTRFITAQASGEWHVTGRELVDVRGLKILSTVLDLEANGTLHTNPIPLPFLLSVQNTTSYRLDADPWQFPLTVGATTVVSSRMNFSEDFHLVYTGFSPPPTHSAGIVWWNVTYGLEASMGIDPPAGHFDAYPIRETFPDGSVTVSFFAPAAGNHARTEAHNRTSTVGTADLVSYRYQALEPPTFLGLTSERWALVAIVIGVVGAVLIWWTRRKRKPTPPPATPPEAPPTT